MRQVTDQSYSKQYFEHTETKDETEIRSGQRHMRRLAATLDQEARSAGSSGVLVIANKAVEDRLPDVWLKPENVDLAHYNAVAGKA